MGLSMTTLNMTEQNVLYVAEPLDDYISNDIQFYCYNINGRQEPFDEVLKWIASNANYEWKYCFIDKLTICKPLNNDPNIITGEECLDKLSLASNGQYSKFLKIYFTNNEDAIHFKLIWG
jgi:hypothetical protein